MKAVLICSSDDNGGAAIVTRRLLHALRAGGVDASMLVLNRSTDDPHIQAVGTSWSRSYAFLKERARIWLANGLSRERLFKVSTADTGIRGLSRHPLVREADVIVLSWINQGLLSLRGIRRLGRLGKPIVWVMHDMWCLTGICHHAGECTRYTGECGCCPLLASSRPADLSHTVWRRKRSLYARVPITFVAVSSWLRDKCRQSSLLRDARVEVIPNAMPVGLFSTTTQAELHLSRIDYSKDLIVIGAARLDDPIKGLPIAIEALNILFMEHPEVVERSQVVLFGALRDPAPLDALDFPYRHLGVVRDPAVVRELYAAAKVVVSASYYETLPSTLIEGQASGCVPVTFDHGGQRDIVDHLHTGYIAEYLNPRSLADGILWALSGQVDPDALHRHVEERFSDASVAARFKALFSELLGPKAT